MTLRRAFRPSRPDLDRFLFAQVGGESDGVPLSVISALTRLGVDPREEAARLALVDAPKATEQLSRFLCDLDADTYHLGDTRQIAAELVALLPARGPSPLRTPQIQIRPRFWPPVLPKPSQLWIACVVVAAAALVSVVMHHGFPFWIGGP